MVSFLLPQDARVELRAEWRDGISCAEKLEASLGARLPGGWPDAAARGWAQTATTAALAAWDAAAAAPPAADKVPGNYCCTDDTPRDCPHSPPSCCLGDAPQPSKRVAYPGYLPPLQGITLVLMPCLQYAVLPCCLSPAQ